MAPFLSCIRVCVLQMGGGAAVFSSDGTGPEKTGPEKTGPFAGTGPDRSPEHVQDPSTDAGP
ncbi:hypothetical protein BMW26_14795 [Microbacterium sp. 1.5R]|nr:hypothetical protein BMW26_14795 [Microbacterium sp. 1.5R]